MNLTYLFGLSSLFVRLGAVVLSNLCVLRVCVAFRSQRCCFQQSLNPNVLNFQANIGGLLVNVGCTKYWTRETGSMGSEKVPAVQNQDVGAEFWCKTCKWLFKNEEAYGLKPRNCGKHKSEITVMGSAAQHAFNMREKDKTKRGERRVRAKAPLWTRACHASTSQ